MKPPSATVLLRLLGAVALAAEAIGKAYDHIRGKQRPPQDEPPPLLPYDPRRSYCRAHGIGRGPDCRCERPSCALYDRVALARPQG